MDIVACNVLNKEQVSDAMAGVDAVVHCAVGDRETIVEGTRNVLQAARATRVERYVYLSTAEVYGNVSGNVDESCPFQHGGSDYGDAKIDAEKLCLDWASKGLPVITLRPSIVYGPFSETWTMDLASRLQSGHWATFAELGEGMCNLIYINDLLTAILSSLSDARAVGQALNVVGPDRVTWNQYFAAFNAALGLPSLRALNPSQSRLRVATSGFIRSYSKQVLDQLNEPISEIRHRFDWAEEMVVQMKRMVKSTPTPRELQNLYSRKAVYVTDRAANLLGYRPQVGLEQGLRQSVQWLAYHGLVGTAEELAHA
jgi:nucleoside-diphosphate-sugar epimerase